MYNGEYGTQEQREAFATALAAQHGGVVKVNSSLIFVQGIRLHPGEYYILHNNTMYTVEVTGRSRRVAEVTKVVYELSQFTEARVWIDFELN